MSCFAVGTAKWWKNFKPRSKNYNTRVNSHGTRCRCCCGLVITLSKTEWTAKQAQSKQKPSQTKRTLWDVFWNSKRIKWLFAKFPAIMCQLVARTSRGLSAHRATNILGRASQRIQVHEKMPLKKLFFNLSIYKYNWWLPSKSKSKVLNIQFVRAYLSRIQSFSTTLSTTTGYDMWLLITSSSWIVDIAIIIILLYQAYVYFGYTESLWYNSCENINWINAKSKPISLQYISLLISSALQAH